MIAKQTKIVATLGPASESYEVIKKLAQAGVNVFRLNMSHGSHEDHKLRFETIRKIEKELGTTIGILSDLQGPKHRIGRFAEGKVAIKAGQKFTFDLDTTLGDENRVMLPHPEVIEALVVGSHVLLDDAKYRVRVIEKREGAVVTEVLTDGFLSNNKGFNIPDVIIKSSVLTEKDRADLQFALSMGTDMIALSFVQTAEDVLEARELIGDKAWIVSKLEKPSAITNVDAIIEASDAIMVARGDLGAECSPEEVPILQKQIVSKCRRRAVPVIVATQMLESMISSPMPTRAEAGDVATAVYDGADAVMLSAESAAGAYPIESVEMMTRIIRTTEGSEAYKALRKHEYVEDERRGREHACCGQAPVRATPVDLRYDAMAIATRQIAKGVNAAAIVTYSESGHSAIICSKQRPKMPVVVLTPNFATCHRLALVYGVRPVLLEGSVANYEQMVQEATEAAKAKVHLTPGSCILAVAGLPFGVKGSLNNIRVIEM